MTSPAPAPRAAMPAPVVEDYLDEDILTVPGQVYALVSIVSPTSAQKSDSCALKIRGVFGTRAEAEAHVRKLQRMDNSFDIFLVDMYKWLMVPPPDVNSIEDQEYADKQLNDLMKGYKESQLAAKQQFAERKRLAIEKGLEAVLTPEERLPRPEPGQHEALFAQPGVHPSAREGDEAGPSARADEAGPSARADEAGPSSS